VGVGGWSRRRAVDEVARTAVNGFGDEGGAPREGGGTQGRAAHSFRQAQPEVEAAAGRIESRAEGKKALGGRRGRGGVDLPVMATQEIEAACVHAPAQVQLEGSLDEAVRGDVGGALGGLEALAETSRGYEDAEPETRHEHL